MVDITYSVTGIEDVERMIAKVRPDAWRKDVEDILTEIAGDAANYPPPPDGSTYVRTFTLRDGWLDAQPSFDMSGDTLMAVLTNPTPYGGYVQGPDDQAWMHEGRWRTTDAIMDSWEGRVAQAIEDGLIRLLDA